MTPIEPHIDRYLRDMQDRRRSSQTVIWYEKRLRPLRCLDQLIETISLTDLDQIYLRLSTQTTQYAFNRSSHPPIEHKPLSPATLRGYVRGWRAFFNWLIDRGVIDCSPARKLKLTIIPAQPPKAISRADMERIVEAARQSSTRDYAICCILADSACRVGGLCNITLDNLDLDRAQAVVIEKGQLRFLLFTERTIEAIRAYLIDRPSAPYPELFIGQKLIPLKPGGIHSLLDRLAISAGVSDRHNPHAWRHGWARAALEAKADISDVAHVLGHRQIQTTYQFYGRWTTGELHQIHDRLTWLPAEAGK